MNIGNSNKQSRLSFVCAVVAATLCAMTAWTQEVVMAKASASASHTDSLKKFSERTEDGKETWYEVVSKETYSASATFTLDSAPEDWTDLAQEISVTVGDIECSPDILKSTAKGGSATWKEKDKETKSAINCSVKWSKKAITVSLSGSNYDGTSIMDASDEGGIEEDVEVSVDLGEISYNMSVPMRGKWKTVVKTVKTGSGDDATTDEFSLEKWNAKGSAKEKL